MKGRQAELLNGLALAYMGDAIYELFIRQYLLNQGQTKPNQLHKKATTYVSARAQAFLIKKMREEGMLSSKEEIYFKRGRNAKSHSKAKNVDHQTYALSTGFEAVMGFLHLTHQEERLEELVEWSIQTINYKEGAYG